MLPRLVSNYGAQAILQPRPPKALGLQAFGEQVVFGYMNKFSWSALVRSQFTATSTYLHLPSSSDSLASASQSTWDYRHPPQLWLIFVFLVETGFCYVGQAGHELPASRDPPTSASQSAGIIGMSHCTSQVANIIYVPDTANISQALVPM
ncbi:hypothetical protein AAY473_024083, partial [Plecturocebus cupreus]